MTDSSDLIIVDEAQTVLKDRSESMKDYIDNEWLLITERPAYDTEREN